MKIWGRVSTPTGIRQLVTVPDVYDVNLGHIVELLSWATPDREPHELEITIYPQAAASGTNPRYRRATFTTVMIDCEHSVGGAAFSTVAPSHDNPAKWRSASWLPDHGTRFRIACHAMKLRLRCLAAKNSFVVNASVQAVTGGPVTPPHPSSTLLYHDPYMVPIGATEFRVFSHSTLAGQLVHFYGCQTIQGTLFPFFDETLETEMLAGDCADWTPVPGTAIAVAAPDYVAWKHPLTICFR